MKYFFLLFLLLAPLSADAVWFNSNWPYRVKVEVVNTQVGSSSAVTNFPVYNDCGGFPASFWTNAQGDGDDIRVVEGDEVTETAFELVAFSTSSQQCELHFLADSLATTSTSTFYVYYGNPSANRYQNADTFGRNNVWRFNYWMVHHATTSAQATDSTVNALNGTPTLMDASNVVAGKVGSSSYDFNGTDEFVTRGTDDASLDFGTNPFSVSFWARPDTWDTPDGLFSKKLSDAGGGYEFFFFGGTPYGDGFRVVQTGPGNRDFVSNPPFMATTSSWQKIDIACAPATGCDMWKNGASLPLTSDSGTYTSIINVTNSFMYGRAEARTYFDGRLDEFRIASTTLSSAHILTEYNNQNSTSTFFRISSEQSGTVTTYIHSGVVSGGAIVR